MPKVSIIIPAYNAELYISDCIQSAISQTEKDIEIIIVNDGSTDNTSSIVHQLGEKDPRIKILSQKNQGLPLSRNNGMMISKGDYIIFVDADDTMEKDMVCMLYNEAIKYNADVVVCAYTNINTYKKKSFIRRCNKEEVNNYCKSDFCIRLNQYQLLNPAWNKIYKRSIFEKTLYRDITPGQDLLFNLELFNNNIVYHYLDVPLYNYYSRGLNSIQDKYKSRIVESRDLLYEAWEELLNNNKPLIYDIQPFLDRLYIHHQMDILKNLYRSGCRMKFKEKTTYIQKVLLNNKIFMNHIKSYKAKNRPEHIFVFLCKLNQAHIINLSYTILGKIYMTVRPYL